MNSLAKYLVLVTIVWSPVVLADYLVVKRNAYIYEEPTSDSVRIVKMEPAEEGFTILELVSSERSNGFYNVRVPESRESGWIYKTLVRRFEDMAGEYEKYRRSLYRHWIDDDRDCQNTRAEVLIRDNLADQIIFKGDRECVVVSGEWLDPYTNQIFTDAKALDVDHVVPLKNAHESGGWSWNKDQKKLYANFMEDPNHLLAVSASENRRKGAKGPDQYLPPYDEYLCEYVDIWEEIKRDWNMVIPDEEASAIFEIESEC